MVVKNIDVKSKYLEKILEKPTNDILKYLLLIFFFTLLTIILFFFIKTPYSITSKLIISIKIEEKTNILPMKIDKSVYCTLVVQPYHLREIKNKQKVIISLYNDILKKEEMIEGEVNGIFFYSSDLKEYCINVNLTEDLNSSIYKKLLTDKKLLATGTVITKEVKLIESFLKRNNF